MYCIKANALSGQVLAPVHRPPFRHRPKMNYNITVPLTIVNDDIAKVWMKEPNDNWVEATEGLGFILSVYFEGHSELVECIDKINKELSIKNDKINKKTYYFLD